MIRYDILGRPYVFVPHERTRREPKPMRWADSAACVGLDPVLFFPPREGPNSGTSAAKAVCAQCPVRLECLDWALTYNENTGVWGGLSAGERRTLKRERRVAC